MSLLKWGFIGLILLPLAEFSAFVVMALLIGWFWTACLFLATTGLGLMILRRSGRRDIDRFRDAFAAQGIYAIHLDSPGLGRVLGGVLLVLPGFITDVLGALLFVPPIRRRLRAVLRGLADKDRRQRDPSLIDLTPKEWHQVSETTPIEDRTPRKRVR